MEVTLGNESVKRYEKRKRVKETEKRKKGKMMTEGKRKTSIARENDRKRKITEQKEKEMQEKCCVLSSKNYRELDSHE